MARRSTFRSGEAAVRFEGLEARSLMSAPYEFKALVDAYGLKDVVYDFAEASTDASLSYGAAVSGLGDINADGYGDFAVAWPERSRVDLFSGKDGAVIRMLERAEVTAFGLALASIGDVNGDGVNDLAVGSPRFDADDDGTADKHGGVWIYSGADGAELRSIIGTGDADELGWVIVGAGDVNGDETPDFIVGAPGAGPAGEGQAVVYSGADGAVLRTFTGAAAGDRFGQAIAARDLPPEATAGDGDGVSDFLIGAPGADVSAAMDQGRAYLYNGATGVLMKALAGQYAGDAYGASVAVAQGGDAFMLLVGAPGYGDQAGPAYGAQDGGAFYLYNWRQGSPAYTYWGYTPGAGSGTRIVNLGHIRSSSDETVAVVSGNGAIEYYDIRAGYAEQINYGALPRPLQVGPSLAAAGDIDGDGFADIISGTLTTEGRVRVSSGLFMQPFAPYGGGGLRISGMSDNSLYAWFTPDYAAGIPSDSQDIGAFVIINGVARSTSLIAGLGRAVIFSMNDSGEIAGADLEPGGSGTDVLGKRFILRDGVKTYLKDEVKTIEGTVAPNLDTIQIVKLGNSGHLLLQSTTPSGYLSWLLLNGKLSLLWEGLVNDVNDAGTVLGVRWKPPALGITVVRYADGRMVDLDGFYNASAINDKGQVAGNFNGQLALWENGTVSIAAPNPTVYGTPTELSWFVYDLDNRGRILGAFRQDYGYGPSSTDYLYTPRLGLKTMYEAAEWYGYSAPGSLLALRDNGWLVMPVGIARPRLIAEIETATPLRSIDTPNGTVSVGITEDGQGYATSTVKGGRLNQVLPTASDGSSTGPTLTDIHVYVDPHDGQVYVVGQSASGVHWWKLTEDGHGNPATISQTSADTSIVRGMTVFTSADGRVHIAGMNADGEMVIYFQNNLASPDSPLNWSAANLTTDHLDPQELETPKFAGTFTAYVAPWNGLNIVGLDEDGELQTVWWAPGMTYWRVDNLSEISGAPKLTGTVSGYVTQWGGLNVAGTDAEGNVQVAWWAPGMAEWRSDPLEGARLTPSSISTYTTPWGGLNVAGLDENGDVAVAWWAPGRPNWTFENLGGDLGRYGEEAIGTTMVSGICSHTGYIELVCRQPVDDSEQPWLEPGRMVRLYLDPTLQQWLAQDVSVSGV
ncbi:MAG: FG-GAP repeat protein [Phycisphaerales bacterium]|nr:FG-GAP repeat protein [Phycisphaerales bacterium]